MAFVQPLSKQYPAEWSAALTAIKGQPTFGDQIAVLAAGGRLYASDKSPQGRVNKLVAAILLDDFMEKYQTIKLKDGTTTTLSDPVLQDTMCVLRTILLPIKEEGFKAALLGGGGSVQQVCDTSMTRKQALGHLAVRDKKAAVILENPSDVNTDAAMKAFTQSQLESFATSFKEGLTAAFTAPAALGAALIPGWVWTLAAVGGGLYLYTMLGGSLPKVFGKRST